MFKSYIPTLLAAATVLTGAIHPVAAAEWMTDFDAAKARAKAENKAVLIDFTGSDWCGWCVRLRSTILDTPKFQQYAADKFVLMEVDVPKNPAKIGAQKLAVNRQIAAHYSVTMYPTMLVVNAQGDVLGGFVGGRDSWEHVTAPLDKALSTETRVQQARQLNGLEQAQALHRLYTELDPALRPYFTNLRDEIAQLDPQNTTGIHSEIRDTRQIEELNALLAAHGHDYERCKKLLLQELEAASSSNKEKIRNIGNDYIRRRQNDIVMSAETVQDVYQLKELLLDLADFSDKADAALLREEAEQISKHAEEILKSFKTKQQRN